MTKEELELELFAANTRISKLEEELASAQAAIVAPCDNCGYEHTPENNAAVAEARKAAGIE